MSYQEWDENVRIKDLEKRMAVLEKFYSEVTTGKKIVYAVLGAIGGFIATLYFSISIWKIWHG